MTKPAQSGSETYTWISSRDAVSSSPIVGSSPLILVTHCTRMGSDYSKDDCVHKPPMDERNLQGLKDYLINYNLPDGHDGCINILLYGMVAAGKSSIINTFFSALDPDGRTSALVPTGTNIKSLTPELRSYKLAKLKFWDTTGWNAVKKPYEKPKVLLRMILEGRIPIGTNLQDFNPTFLEEYPVIPGNAIHGVAFIFDMTTVDNISGDKMKHFQELQTIAAQIYVHRVVIGTKFELLRIKEKNHAWIYEHKPLQQKFEQLSASAGMDKQCMFVICNQWDGDQITMIKCILALYALENMIRNIDRYLKMTA
ncbi:interferon-induced protein 44 [Amblyraja radiata]|uniref:interferon-induced protein 44 n=1 Tax=Amblyraja radiata TaxID=386614 RepID=UPI0014022B58|nr:interferon-induced protein 44 [Amblyraja radiata]